MNGLLLNDFEATRTKSRTPEQLEVDRKRLMPAKIFMEANYKRCPKLGEIAAIVNLSLFHFHHIFTAAFDVTPKDYMASLQIEEAKRLMLSGTPLGEIAEKVGFAHQSHFSSRFKQITGTTPSRWLRGTKYDGAKASVLTFLRGLGYPLADREIHRSFDDELPADHIDAALSHLVAEKSIELTADQKYRAI